MKILVKCGIVLLTLAQAYNGSPLIRFSSDTDDIDNRVIEDRHDERSTKMTVKDIFISVKTSGKFH